MAMDNNKGQQYKGTLQKTALHDVGKYAWGNRYPTFWRSLYVHRSQHASVGLIVSVDAQLYFYTRAPSCTHAFKKKEVLWRVGIH